MCTKKMFLVSMLLFVALGSSWATDYYFSISGNDDNNGLTPATPKQSLTAIQAVLDGLSPGDRVYLERGSMWNNAELLITDRDGTNTSPIEILAYGAGNAPVINCYANISDGFSDPEGDNIWVKTITDLSSGDYHNDTYHYGETESDYFRIWNFLNFLLIDGEIATIGKYPNDSYLEFPTISPDLRSSATARNVTWSNNQWQNGQFRFCPSKNGGTKKQWVLETVKIQSSYSNMLNLSTWSYFQDNTLTTTNDGGIQKGFISNHINTFDLDNEWSYHSVDDHSGTLSVFHPDINNATVQLPKKNTALYLQNSSHINITDIEFRGGLQYILRATNCNQIEIRNCKFMYGAIASILIDAGNDISILNNEISVSCSNGIKVKRAANISIQGNTIEDIGLWPSMGGDRDADNYMGVHVQYAAGNVDISNNLIRNTGYSAIALGGESKENTPNIYIMNNEIHDPCSFLTDGGGIYFFNIWEDRESRDRWVKNNVLTCHVGNPGIQYSGHLLHQAVYLDGLCEGFEIENNASYGFVNGIYLHGGLYNTVKNNNIFNWGLHGNRGEGYIGCDYFFSHWEPDFPYPNRTAYSNITNNTLVSGAAEKPTGSWHFSGDFDPENNHVDSNTYYNPFSIAEQDLFGTRGSDWILLRRPMSEWRSITGFDANSTVNQNGISYLGSTLQPNQLIKLLYNLSNENTRTVDLYDLRFLDIEGNTVQGSVTLAPRESKFLFYILGSGTGSNLDRIEAIAYGNSTPPPDSIGTHQFNFISDTSQSEPGWININPDTGGTIDLGNGLSFTYPSLSAADDGEPATIYPSNVSTGHHYIEDTAGIPKKFIIEGLNPYKRYYVEIFASIDDAVASGDRTTIFSIDSLSGDYNPVGNTNVPIILTHNHPDEDGTMVIEMSKLPGQRGYINALILSDDSTTTKFKHHWTFDGNADDQRNLLGVPLDIQNACYVNDRVKLGSHALGFCTCNGTTPKIELGGVSFETLSVGMWFVPGTGENIHLFSAQDYYYADPQCTLSYSSITKRFTIKSEYSTIISDSIVSEPVDIQEYSNEFHHVFLSMQRNSGRVELFFDGAPLNLTGSIYIPRGLLRIFAGGIDEWEGANLFDDLRIYDGVLSPEEIWALANPGELAAPTEFSAVATSNNSVDLTWNDNSADETGFLILRNSASIPFCAWDTIMVGPNTTSYTDSVLLDPLAARVRYIVRAVRDNINSVNSTQLNVIGITIDTVGSGGVITDKLLAVENDTITATAIPDPGNKFVEWTGDISSTDNPVQILMDAPKSITAVFEEDDDEDVRRIQVSFGPASLPAPVGWNNMHDHWIGAQLSNLQDTKSESTGIDLRLIDGWTNSSSWGHYPGIYPDNVMKGYFYINNDTEQTINLYNLSTSKQYDITLFASRKEYNYTTNYIVDGNTQSLNVYNNTQDTVVFESVMANELGVLTIGCQRASGSNYAYINAMIITERGPSTPQPPVAVEDSYSSIIQGSTLTIDALQGVLANDTDPEGVPLTAVLVSDVSYGTLSLNADGSFVYTHDGSGHLSDAFSYQAYDGMLYSNTVNVQLNLVPEGEEITIKVNFGYEPGWFLPPSDWNSIFGFPSYGNGITNLQNTEGESTGYNIMLQGTWSSFEYLGNYPGVYPDNVMTTNYAYYGDIDRIIQISNLDASSTYDINIFASRKANPAETSFDINGSGNRQSLATLDNTDSTVTFTGISPTVDNEILISCRKEYHAAHINGLILTEYPTVSKAADDHSFGEGGDIHLYPNPVQDLLTIQHLPENCIIRIYNVVGELVHELYNYDEKMIPISMSGYNSGIYTIRILERDRLVSQVYKVIKY